MENRDGEIHVETDEARGGSTPNVVRWVLGIGLLLAIVAMSLAWIIPALSRSDETQNVSYSREVVTDERGDGEVLTGEEFDDVDAPAANADGSGDLTVENENEPVAGAAGVSPEAGTPAE